MDALEQARRIADAVNGDAVVQLTQELVRIDSVAAPGRPHEEAAARHLARRFRDAGFTVHETDVAPQRPNVVAEWTGAGGDGRLLLLEGHTDVVTEGDRERWTRDPFGGELDGGRVWGRGTADMKGGLAAAIVALETVARLAPDLPGSVRVLVPCDEEGMMLGVKRLVADRWHARPDGRPADGAIICEPEENELCLWQRGALRVVTRFHGKQSHGAMPYAGVNPIPWLARATLEFLDVQRELQASVPEHPHLGRPWITPTVASAGSLPQLNVMPGEALLALDVRTVPGVDHADVVRRLEAALERVRQADPACRATLEVIEDRPWTATPADAPVVRALEAAHAFTLHREPRYGGVPGATDGTFLHAAGVPIVTVGPGDREIPHQVDEYVGVDELIASARLYAAAIVLFLRDA